MKEGIEKINFEIPPFSKKMRKILPKEQSFCKDHTMMQ